MEESNISGQTVQPNKYYRRKLFSSYFTSTMCIALVLYLAGLVFLLLFNTQQITDMFRSNITLTVILNDRHSSADVEEFKKRLDASEFVRQSQFISKDEAAKELMEELGENFIEILDNKNPLFNQIEVKLTKDYSNIDSIKALEKSLRKNKVVDEVYFPKDVWSTASSVLANVAFIVSVLMFLLLLVALILIINTVRMQVSVKRFDIRTARLIGATNWRIARPYIKNAVVQGGVAVVMAIVGLVMTVSFLKKIIAGVFQIAAYTPTLLMVVAIGVSLTVVVTYFCVRKFVNSTEEELYY